MIVVVVVAVVVVVVLQVVLYRRTLELRKANRKLASLLALIDGS